MTTEPVAPTYEVAGGLAGELTARVISGFWRRTIAFILDCAVMAIIGIILGHAFFDFLARLGPWGRLLGFVIALAYFGLFNSSIGRGKTIGKLVMGIEVVDKSGNYIPPPRSFLRFTILGIPYFLNGLLLPTTFYLTLVGSVIYMLVFWGGGIIIYLYVFNRRTRQSLHDLAVRSYVVKRLPKGEIGGLPFWKTHILVLGVCFLVSIIVSLTSSMFLRHLIPQGFFAVCRKIESTGKVYQAAITINRGMVYGEGKQWGEATCRVNVFYKTNPDNWQAEAVQTASIVLSECPEIMQMDKLNVTIEYGYDIGICFGWQNHFGVFSPQKWQEMIQLRQSKKPNL